MLDRVVAYTHIEPQHFGADSLPEGWFHTGSHNVADGTLRWDKLEYRAPKLTPGTVSPFTATIASKAARLTVTVSLPRLLYGDNWHVLSEADLAAACAVVDDYLRDCLGAHAQDVPPFSTWIVRSAEYPHDIDLASSGAVERWIRALTGTAIRGIRVNGSLPKPYLNRHGAQTGLVWGSPKSLRTVKVYDKTRQTEDEHCPPGLLRIETKVQNAAEWDKYLPREARREKRRMTVMAAGSVAVAAQVMSATHDALRLDTMRNAGVRNPFPALTKYWTQPQARTLAGFHAFAVLHGERDARAAFPSSYHKHLRRLSEAGFKLVLTEAGQTVEELADLPAIPRPTLAYLTSRTTFPRSREIVALSSWAQSTPPTPLTKALEDAS